MSAERGWTTDDAANDGRDKQQAEIGRLNRKSNAEQDAASRPDEAPAQPPADKAP